MQRISLIYSSWRDLCNKSRHIDLNKYGYLNLFEKIEKIEKYMNIKQYTYIHNGKPRFCSRRKRS